MIVRLIQRHDFRAWLADGRAVRFERDPALRRQAQLARLPRLLEILRAVRDGRNSWSKGWSCEMKKGALLQRM
jgi:hypothetical protein